MPVCPSVKADGSPCTHMGKHEAADGRLYCGYHIARANAAAAAAPPAAAAAVPAPPRGLLRAAGAGGFLGPQPAAVPDAEVDPEIPALPRLQLARILDALDDDEDEDVILEPLHRRGPAQPPPQPQPQPRELQNQVHNFLQGLVVAHGPAVLQRVQHIVEAERNQERLRRQEARRQEARRRQEEAARAAAAEQARRDAEFQRQLREQPVVFQRDPEGSIDLAAFARDAQSVHRSSVQTWTERAVQQLLARPLDADQDTITEIFAAFISGPVRWYTEANTVQSNNAFRDRVIIEFSDNYFEMQAFGVMYGQVVDRVWAYIRSHAEKKQLIVRFAQEIAEGIGMCSNGKMARLVNVLQGYDETLVPSEPSREIFQHKIAALASQPMETRKGAAEALFAEFNIPKEEQEVWLEPLLEA